MTVRYFIDVMKSRPALLDLTLGHSPFNGDELPIEAFQIYEDTTDKGKPCICVSGGGYPNRLHWTKVIKGDAK